MIMKGILKKEFKQKLQLISSLLDCAIYYRNKKEEFFFPNIPLDYRNCSFLTDKTLLNDLCKAGKEVPQLIFDQDESNIIYGVIGFKEGTSIIIGPVAKKKLTTNIITRYGKKHKIEDLKSFYIRIMPVSKISMVLSLIYLEITDKLIQPEYILPETTQDTTVYNDAADTLLQYKMLGSEEEKQHFPYDFEEKMLEKVRTGDYRDVKKTVFAPDNYTGGRLASTEIKATEYKDIGLIALFVRAAITGGMNPYDAYDLGEICMQQTSRCRTIDELDSVRENSFISFCKGVQKAKMTSSENIHIEKCKNYISRHINVRFSFSELANYVGVSESYLSSLFHKIEGKTIREYLNAERLNAAQNMLKFSPLSVSQIAIYLCFTDQSYFCKLFKHHIGMTPLEYRNKNKIKNF